MKSQYTVSLLSYFQDKMQIYLPQSIWIFQYLEFMLRFIFIHCALSTKSINQYISLQCPFTISFFPIIYKRHKINFEYKQTRVVSYYWNTKSRIEKKCAWSILLSLKRNSGHLKKRLTFLIVSMFSGKKD